MRYTSFFLSCARLSVQYAQSLRTVHYNATCRRNARQYWNRIQASCNVSCCDRIEPDWTELPKQRNILWISLLVWSHCFSTEHVIIVHISSLPPNNYNKHIRQISLFPQSKIARYDHGYLSSSEGNWRWDIETKCRRMLQCSPRINNCCNWHLTSINH